jgi:UDP-GlcNAc:undecaprenyl-phosphate GlcNAc-1-phosphate transferase
MVATFTQYAFFICFLVSCFLSLVLTTRVRDFALARGVTMAPQLDRHIHTKPVPRLGGVAIYFSVVLALTLDLFVSNWLGVPQLLTSRVALGLLGPGTIVFLLGLYDDVRGAHAYLKFGIQAFAGLLLYWAGYGIERLDLISSSNILRASISLPLTIFWVLLITNAFNLIDGLDGLAVGSAFFSTVVIFATSLFRHNVVVSLIAAVLAGALLGFLRFNFNPASIFLGDSGSLFVGFMLSGLALARSTQKATTIVAVAVPVVVFGLPILDVVLAVARRLIGAKPIFGADQDHIHHKLLKRGLSHRTAVLVLYGTSAGFGLLSLALLHGEKNLAIVLFTASAGIMFGVHQLRYVEFSELSAFLHSVFKKRIVANNVSIRRAAQQLDSCVDCRTFCHILQAALQPLGFSGFRLESFIGRGLPKSSIHPLTYDPDHGFVFCWADQLPKEPDCELRLQLTTTSGEHLGYLCLFQYCDNRQQSSFDLSVMTDGVRTSISDALHRAWLCNVVQSHQQISSNENQAESKKSISGSAVVS